MHGAGSDACSCIEHWKLIDAQALRTVLSGFHPRQTHNSQGPNRPSLIRSSEIQVLSSFHSNPPDRTHRSAASSFVQKPRPGVGFPLYSLLAGPSLPPALSCPVPPLTPQARQRNSSIPESPSNRALGILRPCHRSPLPLTPRPSRIHDRRYGCARRRFAGDRQQAAGPRLQHYRQ